MKYAVVSIGSLLAIYGILAYYLFPCGSMDATTKAVTIVIVEAVVYAVLLTTLYFMEKDC